MNYTRSIVIASLILIIFIAGLTVSDSLSKLVYDSYSGVAIIVNQNKTSQLGQVASSLSNGLVAHYTFDEGSGTTAGDSSGNNNTGTLTNGPTWVTGSNAKVGSGAVSFDGVDDHVIAESSLGISGYPFSVSSWIQTTGQLGIAAGFFDSASSNIYKALGVSSGAFSVWISNASVGSSGMPVNDGNWHLITTVFESDTVKKMYVDGTLSKTYTTASSYNSSINRFCIGRACDSTPSSPFSGIVDDVRVYNRVLTDAEIAGLYSGSSSGSPTTEPVPGATTTPTPTPTPTVVVPATHTGAWYVDPLATGSQDGTSWTNAWKTFAAIVWSQVQPGDTIYISGGVTQQTYNQSLTIGTSGTSGNPITVKVGQDDGHHGNVIISGAPGTGISIKNRYYVTIDGNYNNENHITVTNAAGNGVYLDSHDKLLHINIYDNGYTDQLGNGVLIFSGADYFEIGYCSIKRNYEVAVSQPSMALPIGYGHSQIHHNDITDISYDGIKGGLRNLDFYNNEIGRLYTGGKPGAHLDMFQASNMTEGMYLRIFNNHIFDFTNSVTYFEDADDGVFDHFLFYNNVVEKAEYGGADLALFVGRGARITLRDIIIASNVFKNMDRSSIILGGTVKPLTGGVGLIVANNMFIDNGSLSGTAAINTGLMNDTTNSLIDHNLVFADVTGSNKVFVNGKVFSSWADPLWNAAYPTWSHNLNGDPKLAPGYYPQEGSLVIDRGVDLSEYESIAPGISKDKNGVPRIYGTGWDIGAYEYVSGIPSVPTPTATVTPSVTPPVIDTPPTLGPITTSVLTTSVTLSFTTNEPTVTTISYGLTSTLGNVSSPSTNSLNHSHTLTNLEPNTTYYYTIKARDTAGNITTSAPKTFTTSKLSVTLPVVTTQPVVTVAPTTLLPSYPSSSHTATTTPSRLPPTFRFTTQLNPYTTSLNVKNLQIFLNDHGFTLTTTGAGSEGNETTYYGPLTKQAVTRFQNYYKPEILTANRLTRATGQFGPASMKKANQLLTVDARGTLQTTLPQESIIQQLIRIIRGW